MKALGISMVLLLGSGLAEAQERPSADAMVWKIQNASPSAPRVTCNIRMNYWCIVQADATVNMAEAGDYRVWTMTAPDSRREAVTVRESKNCDSPSDLRPRRTHEGDERRASGQRWHAVELALSADGACTLKIEYLAGDSEWAREAQQLANYQLYLCMNGSCRTPLLSIR